MLTECYIVRIYRKDRKALREVIGVVEKVGVDGASGFRNSEELLKILLPPEDRSPRPGRKESMLDHTPNP